MDTPVQGQLRHPIYLACLHDNMDAIFLQLSEDTPELKEEEIDDLAEAVFSARYGQSYEKARKAIEAKYKGEVD